MTHFATIVLVPRDRDDIEHAVAHLLEPYDENGEMFRDGSRWDWWVVGGRFTGLLDGYDPTKDPLNYETCRWCVDGITTQEIANQYPAYQPNVGLECFQCKGTSKTLKWTLVPHDGDVLPVSRVNIDALDYLPTAVVTPDGEWHESARMGWFGATIGNEKDEEDWRQEVADLFRKNYQAIAVVVDCHV